MSLCIAVAAPCSATQPGLPTTAKPISIDSINLRADVFFNNLTSQTDQVRERAQLFLLGVQDATEGKSWCGYRAFKTITLREDVYEYFKKLPHERLSERASVIIEEALHKNYPCKAKK
jgi:Rap1a immunity proteins